MIKDLPQQEAFLPQHTSLGVLNIIDVYEYYDQPVLFACQNQKGTIFLAVWVDENRESQLWLYAPMSQRRFEQVRSGAIDLKSAFLYAEDNVVFSVRRYFRADYQPAILLVAADSLIDNQLPIAGESLALPTDTLPAPLDTVNRRALQTRREEVDLGLTLIEKNRNEAPIARLGALLQTFQSVMNNIGNKLRGRSTQRGTLPQQTVADMQFYATGFASGSFVVQLASSAEGNIFSDTFAGDALNELIVLVQLAEQNDELHARLMDLGPRVASAFVAFLQTITLEVASVKLDWGSPNTDKGGSVTITSELAQRTAGVIGRFEEQAVKEYNVSCVLVGGNFRLMKFELEVGDSHIAGDVDKSAQAAIIGAVLGNSYTATIRSIESFRPMIESSSLQYILLDLRDSTPPEDTAVL